MSNTSEALARSITRSANGQAYATIRWFADAPRRADAFRAYAYFRWVDDTLDLRTPDRSQALAFVTRQQKLIEAAYRGLPPAPAVPQEEILLDLICRDPRPHGGLAVYIRHMMDVMAFDAGRRGRLISEAELASYTCSLATAVIEVLHHFIAPEAPRPRSPARTLAVAGAHIAHMLRDTRDDLAAGYVNIPLEVLRRGRFGPAEFDHIGYRAWIRARVELARRCLAHGKRYLTQVGSFRFRLAALGYTLRFERLLDAIEREGYGLPVGLPAEGGSSPMALLLASAWAALRPTNRRALPPLVPRTPSASASAGTHQSNA
jgi:phytoene/squalene synthetase